MVNLDEALLFSSLLFSGTAVPDPDGDVLATGQEHVVLFLSSDLGRIKSFNPSLLSPLEVSTPPLLNLPEVLSHQGSFPGEVFDNHHQGVQLL
ncbi:hypothetical protein LIER_22501 [Lithospermum erythrorhizon]|uniref:Uncharacterized protein n=1 Tax=Lithospermum erythrorhizon TaxID=34254 RepID=A0AAV3QYC7_LITER